MLSASTYAQRAASRRVERMRAPKRVTGPTSTKGAVASPVKAPAKLASLTGCAQEKQ
jgi:hypothetical protein